MMRGVCLAILMAGLMLPLGFAASDETDQYLTWGRELRDSADIVNRTFNDQVREAIAFRNAAVEPPCDCPAMAFQAIDYVFAGRLVARFTAALDANPDIDMYPARDVKNLDYQSMSIYRGITFPFILPMSPTIRVGDVYFGGDKWGHFLGMGKRYYKHYLYYRRTGNSEDKAIDMTINWGVISENTIVGKVVDGIFSHADLEANYQGFEMARHMCEGDAPYIERVDKNWELVREIDLRDYITPYWDESWNPNHYWGRRRQLVLPLLSAEYADKAELPEVLERFRAYEKYPPSRSVEYIRRYFSEREQYPQHDQTFTALRLPPDYPIPFLTQTPEVSATIVSEPAASR